MYTTDGRDTRETVVPYQGYNRSFDICPLCGKPAIYIGDYFGGPKLWCACGEDKMPILTDTFVRGSNYTQGVYDDWGLDWSPDWSPDPDVSCALPDLRYVFYLALGAVVVVAALVMWIVKR